MRPAITEVNESAIGQIQKIAYETWPVSYRKMISKEQIAYMLKMMYSEESLREQFAQGIRFIICHFEDKPVGFAGAGPKENTTEIWRLEKLYVLPDMQSRGIGKLLLEEVIKMASTAKARILELNVNRNNPALQFYQKAGFNIHETLDLPIGGGFFMNDHILRKLIS